MEDKGYIKYGKVIWLKTTESRIPVNFIGKRQRHSTETMLIFSIGKVSDLTKYHKMNDVLVAPFTS